MHDEKFNYHNQNHTFLISHRKALSHNMPDRHFHSTYELFYLVSGERRFFIKDRGIEVRAGDLVLIQPNILHMTTNAKLPEHERIIINFHEDFLIPQKSLGLPSLYALFENEYVVVSFSLHHRLYIEELFHKILQEVQQKHTGFELYAQTLLQQLLIFFCRFVEENSINPLPYLSPIHERISEVVRFINERYNQDMSLSYLADRFFISPYYLSRAFKEVTGFGFTEYLNNVRVKEAKKLLEETELKVNKISEKVGFGSITHFGRVFREITGHPPLYYRKTRK